MTAPDLMQSAITLGAERMERNPWIRQAVDDTSTLWQLIDDFDNYVIAQQIVEECDAHGDLHSSHDGIRRACNDVRDADFRYTAYTRAAAHKWGDR